MGPRITLLVGPPGSGKSTLAKKMIEVETDTVYINQDSQGKSGHMDLFLQAVHDGKSIIVDRMNFNKAQRNNYFVHAKEKGYRTRIIVIHEPFDVCMQRAIERVGHETIKDEKNARQAIEFFFKSYERPTEDEADSVVFRYPEGEKPLAVWCDLDGTLADCEHRRHHVRKPEGQKKDWRSFFLGMTEDRLVEPVAQTLRSLGEKYKVLYCSGRPDDYKKETQAWLKKHGMDAFYDGAGHNSHGQWADLYMRRRHDSRQDNIVKEIILDFEVLTRYRVFMCLDDRDQVVKMLRGRGLTVFQVAEGDF